MVWLPSAVMVAAIAICVVTDIKHGKIYNAVTAPAAAIGIITNVIAHWTAGDALAGLTNSLLGIALGFGLFLVSTLLGRILGGGDIKLLMVIGACNGPMFLLWTIVFMALAGGLMALAISLWQQNLFASLKRLIAGLAMRAFTSTPMDVSDSQSTARLPYALPIAVGSLMALYAAQLPQFGINLV